MCDSISEVICPHCGHKNKEEFHFGDFGVMQYLTCKDCKKSMHVCQSKGNKGVPLENEHMKLTGSQFNMGECFYCSCTGRMNGQSERDKKLDEEYKIKMNKKKRNDILKTIEEKEECLDKVGALTPIDIKVVKSLCEKKMRPIYVNQTKNIDELYKHEEIMLPTYKKKYLPNYDQIPIRGVQFERPQKDVKEDTPVRIAARKDAKKLDSSSVEKVRETFEYIATKVDRGYRQSYIELIWEFCSIRVAKILIKIFEKTIDDESKWGWLFYLACSSGDRAKIELAIDNGADDWSFGLEGACESQNMDIVYMMLRKGGEDYNFNWDASLDTACRVKNSSAISLMISKGAKRCSNCYRPVNEH